jgi:hypothetical protein
MATKEHINSYEEFKIKFLDQYWSKESQSHTRAQIYQCKYDKSTDGSMASHLLKYAVLGISLQPPMSKLGVTEAVTSSYTPWVQRLFITSNIKTIQDASSVLNNLDPLRVNTIIHGNGLIRTDHMHVAVMVQKTTGMEGHTQ